MEHLQHGMKRKWERHFRETNTNISVALMVLGLSFLVSLLYVYPQKFSKIIFDSRLAFNLMVDVEDYWTCTKQYDAFVVDEPSADIKLFAFFVFNVTNTLTVIQRGFKPIMVELGPYGYLMHSYKYDVYFEPEGSTTISFKEYNVLRQAPVLACQRMYYRMDKEGLADGDPCLLKECTCQDTSDIVTIINPLYAKVLKEESSNSMISQYAVEIFQTMKDMLEINFVESVKAHMVPSAYEELYIVRRRMQTQTLLNISFDYMKQTLNDTEMNALFLATNTEYTAPATCGLDEAFGVTECRWNAGESLRQVRFDVPATATHFRNVTDDDIPYNAVPYLLDRNNLVSFHNTTGMLHWLAISVFLEYQDFPFVLGSAMTDLEEMEVMFDDMKAQLVEYAFPTDPTNDQILACEMLIHIVAHYISERHIAFYGSALTTLVYEEWFSTSHPVPCSFTNVDCVWQWGAIAHLNNFEMDTEMKFSWIDRGAKVNTNPLSLYYDGNSAMMYNSYRYCQEAILPGIVPTSCMDIDYAQEDCEVNFPAAIAGMDADINQLDTDGTMLHYLALTDEEKMYWTLFGCNISYLIHEVYRNSTGFHDEYVIRYINKYKLDSFTHTFEVGKWDELGHAQWGGGFVTQAILGVYSIYNIERNGMWYFGQRDYYDGLLEYHSWAVRSGYPDALLSNVTEARILLETLSSPEPSSVELRRFIMFQSTTLVGDGTNHDNGVGDEGEIAFTNENNIADYTCPGASGENIELACDILAVYVNSSSDQCLYIDETIFFTCTERIRKLDNWVTNCERFETSMSSPLQGIQCDTEFVYGRGHPYLKSRGLVLSKMMFGLVIEIILKLGLWCPNYDNCDFDRSGLFTTIPVQKLLFEGFSDASVLRYLDTKYMLQGVNFECVNEPYDECGIQSFYCDAYGIKMDVGNETMVLQYGNTSKEKYFVDRFYVYEGKLIWPYDINTTLAQESRAIIAAAGTDEVFTIINPYFTFFPAWESGDEEFQKFYQCQGRYLYGPPELFNSCTSAIDTGTDKFSKLKHLKYYNGNETVYIIGAGINTTGTIDMQLESYRWDGFRDYPYTVNGENKGPSFENLPTATIFNRIQALRLELNQDLLEPFDRTIMLTTPFHWWYEVNTTDSLPLPARRYLESVDTWLPFKNLGQPVDSFGMPYTIPTGMSSLIDMSGGPLFIGTPHNYGNEEWGGKEYLHVIGLDPDQRMHKTFIDYDPITGKMLRVASRQQITLRVERTSLHTILFSSQKRCISPTKTFTDSTGYGCFGYIPILWMEESRTIRDTEFRDLFIHYYTRPCKL